MIKFEWKNVEFNIGDMLRFLLKKIKFVIVITAVFALLVPGIKYGMDKASYTTNNQPVEQYEVLRERLDMLQNQVKEEEQYRKDSYIMNIDYTQTNVGVLQLYIDVTDERNAKNVSTLIKDYCSNGGLFYDITDGDKEIRKIREVISISYDEKEQQLDTTNVCITVYGTDEDGCKELIEDIKGAVVNYSVNLCNTSLENTVSIINEVYYKDVCLYVKQYQTNFEHELQLLKNDVATLTSEIEYRYSALAVEPTFSIKMLILGAVLGAILASIIVIACYLFSNKVKYAEELSEITNLRLITEISKSEVEIAAKQIKTFLNVNNVAKCCIVGAVSADSIEPLNYVLNNANTDMNKVKYVENVFEDEKSFDDVIDAKNVILIVENWKTDYDKLKNIISFCQTYGCEIVGYIVL